MAAEIILVGVKKYEFEKNGDTFAGVTLHVQSLIPEEKGIGYEVDRISISAKSELYDSVIKDIKDEELSCGDIIELSYNKYGKVVGLTKVC